jgi:hypothetical protein
MHHGKAQPLIWAARIFTSLMRVGSRLEAMASDEAVHFLMSSGAAAKRKFDACRKTCRSLTFCDHDQRPSDEQVTGERERP